MGEVLLQRIKQARFESPAHEALLNLFVAAGHMRERTERVFSEHDVTHAQYNVLRILRGAHPGGYPRCEIIARMLERAPDVTRLIDRLEQQGLVERDRSEEDRRLSISRITDKGLALLDRIAPLMEEVHRYFGERVSRRDCRELSRICEGIYAEED